MNNQRIVLETSSQLRKKGALSLAGKWKQATVATMIFTLLTLTVAQLIDEIFGTVSSVESLEAYGELAVLFEDMKSTPLSGLYLLLVYGAFSFGLAWFFLKLVRQQNPTTGELFIGFSHFGKSLGLFLWQLLWICLWGLIPFVGIVFAIIAAIRYSQAFFLMIDYPELSIRDCVNESKRIMEGNKGKYFVYHLSFIGWYLLALLPVLLVSTALAFWENINEIILIVLFVFVRIGVYMVDAYLTATNVHFYQILTDKETGEIWTPGEY